jgi:hypothetical protein
MLQVITGTNYEERVKARMRAAAGRPHSVVGPHNALSEIYERFVVAGGLFGQVESLVVTQIDEIAGLVPFLEQHSTDIMESPQILILEDIGISTPFRKFCTLHGITIETHDSISTQKPNVFSLTDALASGSKKSAFRSYHALLAQSIDAQECIGPIWWWLKNLGQAYRGIRTAKPFVQKKLDTAVALFGDTVPTMIATYIRAIHFSRTTSHWEQELELWILESMPKN